MLQESRLREVEVARLLETELTSPEKLAFVYNLVARAARTRGTRLGRVDKYDANDYYRFRGAIIVQSSFGVRIYVGLYDTIYEIPRATYHLTYDKLDNTHKKKSLNK